MPEPLCQCTAGSTEGFWKLRQAPASGRIEGLRILNYSATGVGEALTRAALASVATTPSQKKSLEIYEADEQITPAIVRLHGEDVRLPANLWVLAREAAACITMSHILGERVSTRCESLEAALEGLANLS